MGFTPDCDATGDINWFTVGDLSKTNSMLIDVPETKRLLYEVNMFVKALSVATSNL